VNFDQLNPPLILKLSIIGRRAQQNSNMALSVEVKRKSGILEVHVAHHHFTFKVEIIATLSYTPLALADLLRLVMHMTYKSPCRFQYMAYISQSRASNQEPGIGMSPGRDI
jgi:hypothetical protein